MLFQKKGDGPVLHHGSPNLNPPMTVKSGQFRAKKFKCTKYRGNSSFPHFDRGNRWFEASDRFWYLQNGNEFIARCLMVDSDMPHNCTHMFDEAHTAYYE